MFIASTWRAYTLTTMVANTYTAIEATGGRNDWGASRSFLKHKIAFSMRVTVLAQEVAVEEEKPCVTMLPMMCSLWQACFLA